MTWQIEFFKDPSNGRVYGIEFLDRIPDEVAGELEATLKAVEGHEPPYGFKGGLRWTSMHGKMSGWFEARDQHGNMLYRLFVLLDRDAPGLEHSAITVIAGSAKENETAFTEKFYAAVRKLGERYLATDPRSVADEL